MQFVAQEIRLKQFRNLPALVAASNNNKEVAMTTVASIRHSDKWMTCARCGEALIAPEWSEYVSEQLILNLWSCTNCDYRFETEAFVPADAKSEFECKLLEEVFPSLLVA